MTRTCAVLGGGWDAPSGEDSSPADACAAENASATTAARMVSARVMALSWFGWVLTPPLTVGRTGPHALAGNPYTRRARRRVVHAPNITVFDKPSFTDRAAPSCS